LQWDMRWWSMWQADRSVQCM